LSALVSRSGLSTCALAVALTMLAGCVHVRLESRALLKPDRGPKTAHLGPGYRLEDGVFDDGEEVIGFTRAHRDGNRLVLLFYGGDSFHRSVGGGEVLEALARDVDVVTFDYPGFGDSSGTPDVQSLLRAGRAVRSHFAQLARSSGQRLVLYGFSLGAMVAAQSTVDGDVDALVLEAGANDVRSWAWSQVPWALRAVVRIDIAPDLDQIDSANALAGFRGPVLVLAGTRDRRVPPRLSRELVRLLKRKGVNAVLLEFEGAGHGEIHTSAHFGPRLDRFLAHL
jgi:pimeloyl-ACP methyl ester carboxylesterase